MAKKKKKKNKKVRAEFRKKHETRVRKHDLTRQYQQNAEDEELENMSSGERVTGRSQLRRHRTVVGSEAESEDSAFQVQLAVNTDVCRRGRVLSVRGLNSDVKDESGKIYTCAIRGVLKSLATDLQNVVVAGDDVMFEPIGDQDQGVIASVEPRRNFISRTSRSRQHVIVSNVDQILIMASAAEPGLKPNLVDRFLVSAEKSKIQPIICINKIDLVPPSDLQPVAGVWGQLGYQVVFVSATKNIGIAHLQQLLRGKDSVVCGQSGVGKSSLLNAIEPGLNLRVGRVSSDNQKGRHTTTSAQLIGLSMGGHIIDTPGIRQFQLWDIVPEEVDGFFRDIRPYVGLCKFPDCTHIHEDHCAVKDAVADNQIDVRRYESYFQIRES